MNQILVGTWHLVSQMTIDPDGGQTPSRGENPMGILMYDAAGNMAVQLMRTDDHAAMYTDLSSLETALAGFLSYFGRYEVDPAARVVHHHITGSSSPAYRGTTQTRHYDLSDDRLTLRAASPVDDTVRVLVWRRG